MEIRGLPLHALVVHAAVVLGPMAALLAIAFAALKSWRWALRWPSLVLSLAAVGAVLTAFLSGRDYLGDNPGLKASPAVATHSDRAQVLLWVILVYGLFAVVAAFTLSGPTALASGRGGMDERGAAVEWTVAGLLVASAVVMLVYVALVGDAGAQSVWRSG